MSNQHLFIDIETFSSVDIKRGLYNYVQPDDFEILLFAYSFEDGTLECVDLACGETLPAKVIDALSDPKITKHAYNAAFEITCINKFWHSPTPQWKCTMIHGLYCGYTAGLAATAMALGLDESKQKMREGAALIRTFCIPCKPSNSNGNRLRTLPHHEPEKWDIFKRYCLQDVAVEMEIERRLWNFPLPESEQKLWVLDQTINDTGIGLDRELIEGALHCDAVVREELTREAVLLSGLENPNSAKQLKDWLEDETGEEVQSVSKIAVSDLIESLPECTAKRVLEIRQELSKTSVKKYATMQSVMCNDNRARGLLQFYGANRTGRWGGRAIQPQNLPRNYIGTLSLARKLVKSKNIDALKLIYGNVPDTLSQLIRTALIPKPGHVFIVADFSAIEARVIAWLAGEQWVLDVFNTHGKIYEATASQMFGVPIEKITKGNPEYELRQKGKVATLALGYQGSTGALIAMGALRMGIPEDELSDIVGRWRSANRRIVDLWYSLNAASMQVVSKCQSVGVRGLMLSRECDPGVNQDFFTVTLPSGRKLYYVKPFFAENKFGKQALHYYGLSAENGKTKKWGTLSTYGGKLAENCVQAIARDCLAETLTKLSEAGYKIVTHIHDEIVLEVPKENADLEPVLEIMRKPISWAPGLPLDAAGFICEYYQKD